MNGIETLIIGGGITSLSTAVIVGINIHILRRIGKIEERLAGMPFKYRLREDCINTEEKITQKLNELCGDVSSLKEKQAFLNGAREKE